VDGSGMRATEADVTDPETSHSRSGSGTSGPIPTATQEPVSPERGWIWRSEEMSVPLPSRSSRSVSQGSSRSETRSSSIPASVRPR
jgi:hypothetical protein